MNDTNEAAFPTANGQFFGMSLRDYFAAKAIHVAARWEEESPTSSDGFPSFTGVAKRAYRMADAMLAARSPE